MNNNNNNNNNNNRPSHDDVASTSGRRSSPYPPGYRFIPTDKELIIDYLVKKVNDESIPVAEMSEVNLYRYPPQYLAENYPQLGEKEWYFFTPRDRKYPNGNRPKRSVEGIGYWKATGADTLIRSNGELIGKKKSLVFYLGKPKSGDEEKTKWIMHEYKLNTPSRSPSTNSMRLDDWVLCRIYNKPERPSKKRKNADEHDEAADRDNTSSQISENNNNEGVAALDIPDNNHDHGLNLAMMTMIDGDNHHQFPANYQEDEFNYQALSNLMSLPGPSHDDMNNLLCGQNNFDYGMPYDRQYYLNEHHEAVWDSHQQGYLQQDINYWNMGNNGINFQQDINYWNMGNNGISFQQPAFNVNSHFSVDDYLKVEEGSWNNGSMKNPHAW